MTDIRSFAKCASLYLSTTVHSHREDRGFTTDELRMMAFWAGAMSASALMGNVAEAEQFKTLMRALIPNETLTVIEVNERIMNGLVD